MSDLREVVTSREQSDRAMALMVDRIFTRCTDEEIVAVERALLLAAEKLGRDGSLREWIRACFAERRRMHRPRKVN